MRSVESAMRALVQEQAAGRDAFVHELRQEIKLLGRTLAAMKNPPPPSPPGAPIPGGERQKV